jgi:hypothetical protein
MWSGVARGVVVALTAALMAALVVACGAPSPVTGPDSAKPKKTAAHPPSSLVASPDAVSQAVVDAWSRNDRGVIGQLTTATARDQITSRSFPQPQPMFVNCRSEPEAGGQEGCLFQVGSQQLTLVTKEKAGTGWLVTDVRFST